MLSFADRKDRISADGGDDSMTMRSVANRLQCAGDIDAAAHIYGHMYCAAEITSRSKVMAKFSADYAQLLEICCRHSLAVDILRRAIEKSLLTAAMSKPHAENHSIGKTVAQKIYKYGPPDDGENSAALSTEKYLCHLLLLKLLFCRPQALETKIMAEIRNLIKYLEGVQVLLTSQGVDTKHGKFKSHWSYFHIIRGLMRRERRLNSSLRLCMATNEQCTGTLFCIGDSHVVSIGHRRIRSRVNGKFVRTVPWVITGLKAWHVHLGDSYFTGANLRRALQSIVRRRLHSSSLTDFTKELCKVESAPTLKCIISAGEIDVREGIVNAIESQKYRDSAEAVRVTCEKYISSLHNMICEVDPTSMLKIYIFPVLPHRRRRGKAGKYRNRQCRRNLQGMWNLQLKQILSTCAETYPQFSFLDIASSVEETTGPFMRPELSLDDGTHANARIIEAIQSYMESG